MANNVVEVVGSNNSILDIENLTKVFGKLTAVDDLSLSIPSKTIFGLLGPNGAGKTTLIRMIAGLVHPTKGKIRLFGNLPPESLKARGQIGYMPQDISIYPGLSVLENIYFFGRIYGLEKEKLIRNAEEALEFVELSAKRNTQVSELSGGMVRRVSLATALVHKPKFLVLDEPTAGVDPLLRLKIWTLLEELASEGTSILITTHHISEARECGNVVFMRNGSLIDQGAPQSIMDKYSASDLESAFVKATEERGNSV
ncbi:MAG: ABC transporter ATP-binding protein [Nitrospinota bacterium]|nr:ABC transporter ATP-binding protein [Nitrospinota bacterium]